MCLMAVVKINKTHAEQVARLHLQGIKAGFISSLGLEFLTELYEGIVASTYAFGFVVEQNAEVLGFAVFATNVKNLYNSVLLRKGLRLAFILLRRMFCFSRIKRAFETLLYPNRMQKMSLPRAELLAVAVAAEAQGRNLGTNLVQKGLAECRRRGIKKVKVMVGAENKPANKLYVKCGFKLLRQITNHGRISNIYVVVL